jgi:glycine cleavage system H lipoate-binding protein
MCRWGLCKTAIEGITRKASQSIITYTFIERKDMGKSVKQEEMLKKIV